MNATFNIATPIGEMRAEFSDSILIGLKFIEKTDSLPDFSLKLGDSWKCSIIKNNRIVQQSDQELVQNLITQLTEYFAGKRKTFSVPLALNGTKFQQVAWQVLLSIPYGNTITYKEQTECMNHPRSSRAVGGANGKNPIVIIVPCHRVIGSDGSLTGYSDGVNRKRWLLNFERANSEFTSYS